MVFTDNIWQLLCCICLLSFVRRSLGVFSTEFLSLPSSVSQQQLNDFYLELAERKNISGDPDFPIITPCQPALDEFSIAAVNFTNCAIENSIPPEVCLNCIDQWIALDAIYWALVDGDEKYADVTERGESCTSLIFDDYLVSYVRAFYESMEQRIWHASRCSGCITYNTNKKDGGAVMPGIWLNKTIEFNEKLDLWRNCRMTVYMNNTGKPDSEVYPVMCDTCSGQYEELYDYFWDQFVEPDTRFCLDIESHMNHSTWVWRDLYNCSVPYLPSRGKQAWAVGLVSGFLLVATAIFYIGSFVQGTKQQRELRKYSTMKPGDRQRAAQTLREANEEPTSSNGPAPGFDNPSYNATEGYSDRSEPS